MTAADDVIEMARVAAAAAADKLGEDVVAFDVSEQLGIADVFWICSVSNDPQLRAVVDEIELKLREIGEKPLRREGDRASQWILLDYGALVINVMHAETRAYYALERLWRDCPVVHLPS